jgi:hypothetical protein
MFVHWPRTHFVVKKQKETLKQTQCVTTNNKGNDISYVGPSGRAVCSTGHDRLDADIVNSNPAQGMDVCPHLSVFVQADNSSN